MELLIATKNPGKFSEIAEILKLPSVILKSLADLGLKDEVEEHGATHEENAILKARYFFEKTGMPTLGEDSGIYIDVFPDSLGVQTRRWGGLESATDSEWIKFFLEKMKNVPPEKRSAKFVCYSALIFDEKSHEKPHVFFGETQGAITAGLEAPLIPGIPISSCFRPENSGKVYAALSPEEKNKISHRGKAMHAAKEFIQKNLV